ncbi:lymphatic vessel endothelial hyaluronic receptor 1b [Hippoglossus hippoglossus]|uniref:lymphatic vessel endothelial hyaluronic receptor 1b n=1 Tax=Hippoglossus hippoglossus TaxID=8267 RepID=UPI00148D8189|nr:lymphatic vessel endothelial hyaluronic receptor 1b [Hippoglossus hippoglossus]
MARLWSLTQFLLVCFVASFLASESNVMRAAPHSPRVAGVFMLIEGGKYTLNFTSARAACLLLNVTIATKNQMERAVQQGLEMCKYGWIAEQIGAIPRIISDQNCGKGKTGLVLWWASPNKTFGVFCFNASDSEETLSTTKAVPQTSTSPTMLTSLTQTPTPTTPTVKSTTRAPSSRKPKTTKSPEPTSASTLLVETTRSTRISSTYTSLDPFSTHIPTSLISHLISSKPTVGTVAFSTSVSVVPQSESSAKTSLGVVRTALIILGVILLLLAAAGAMWYYKLNLFRCLGQQKDDIETEMWKHTDSEMDLHSQHGAEEGDECEEPDRKYSSDITLCVNPDIKNN